LQRRTTKQSDTRFQDCFIPRNDGNPNTVPSLRPRGTSGKQSQYKNGLRRNSLITATGCSTSQKPVIPQKHTLPTIYKSTFQKKIN
jgi:hypothetical protein